MIADFSARSHRNPLVIEFCHRISAVPFPPYIGAKSLRFTLITIALLLSTGCIDGGITKPENPSFSMKAKDASTLLKEMSADPKPLDRPLVILAGIGDPGLGPMILEWRLGDVVRIDDAGGNRRTLRVSFAFNTSFEGCRRVLIDAVERAFPCDDPDQTTEVDVIGISLGGTVARYAAMGPPDASVASARRPDEAPHAHKRLRIARLFTISSPHLGAVQADHTPSILPIYGELRTGSPFMKKLEASPSTSSFPIYAYVRLGDKTVGAENAAPRGQSPHWLPNLPFEIAHGQAWTDPRILADIARHLRSEPALATDPPAPLPDLTSQKTSPPGAALPPPGH
jgi:pimeloyl-ACP methyl ester carboxylesterase